MDGKIFVYLVLLAGIIGLISFVNHSNAIDEVTQQITLSQQQSESLKVSMRFQSDLLELRQEVAALLTASDIVMKEMDVVRDEVKGLRDREASLRRAFENAVLQVRADSIGVVFPVVPLNNGVKLKNAKVQSIDADILTILHSEGVSKVPPGNLPTDLQDRFRFGTLPGESASALEPQALRSTRSLAGSDETRFPNTSASDNLLRRLVHLEGVEAPATKPAASSNVVDRPDAAALRISGDPDLWKSVTRQSIGRAYIPGQGWLEVGPNGPRPGTGRQ